MLFLAIWLFAAELGQGVRALPKEAPPAKSQTESRPEVATEVEEVVVVPIRPPPEPDWSKRLNFDPSGKFATSATPYLGRRPANGCKIMAGGVEGPAGESGAATGMVCAKRF